MLGQGVRVRIRANFRDSALRVILYVGFFQREIFARFYDHGLDIGKMGYFDNIIISSSSSSSPNIRRKWPGLINRLRLLILISCLFTTSRNIDKYRRVGGLFIKRD